MRTEELNYFYEEFDKHEVVFIIDGFNNQVIVYQDRYRFNKKFDLNCDIIEIEEYVRCLLEDD